LNLSLNLRPKPSLHMFLYFFKFNWYFLLIVCLSKYANVLFLNPFLRMIKYNLLWLIIYLYLNINFFKINILLAFRPKFLEWKKRLRYLSKIVNYEMLYIIITILCRSFIFRWIFLWVSVHYTHRYIVYLPIYILPTKKH